MLYLSTAASLYSDNDLQEILEVSRSNNTRQGITGILLYHDGAILQVLEGDEHTVIQLFEKLKRDSRHHNIFKVLDGPLSERYFSEWSMGFKRLSSKEWDQTHGYLPVSGKMVSKNSVTAGESAVLTFIKSFCESNFQRQVSL